MHLSSRFVTLSAVCVTLLSSSVAQLDGTLSCSSDFTSNVITTSGGDRRYRLSITSFSDTEISIDTCSSTTDFDTVVELYDEDDFLLSNRIEWNDDRPFGVPNCQSIPRASYIHRNLFNIGDYYIRVRGLGTATGEFGLRLRCGTGNVIIPTNVPSVTLDAATGGVIAGAVITYIVLGTVLPCIVICVCIACCVHYSNKSSRTTVVQPMPVVQQGAVVVQPGSYPQQQVVQPVSVAPGGVTPIQQQQPASFYPAVQPAAQPSPMLQPMSQPVQPVPVMQQPQDTPSAPPPAY